MFHMLSDLEGKIVSHRKYTFIGINWAFRQAINIWAAITIWQNENASISTILWYDYQTLGHWAVGW